MDVLFEILNYAFVVYLFFQIFYFILIVSSPHPDTSLRVLGNILISGALFFSCEFVVSSAIFCFIIRIIVFVCSGLLSRYLRNIKYCS